MKGFRWIGLLCSLSLGLAMLAAVLVLPGMGRAQTLDTGIDGAAGLSGSAFSTTTTASFSASAAGPPSIGAMSVDGSSITTANCYQEGKTETLCFTVYNGSTDAEWLDEVQLAFPVALGAWNVACKFQDATDSSGNPVNMACSNPAANEVLYLDNDVEVWAIGEISSGSSWGFCVDVIVPAAYAGPRLINWEISGDQDPGSSPPHDIAGQLEIGQCMLLMIYPAQRMTEGCNGITQTYSIDVWNNTGSGGTFDLVYDVPSGNAAFVGPLSLPMAAGDIVTFTVQLQPELCLHAGDVVTASLRVEGQGQSDESVLVQTISDLAGWETRQPSPAPSMDSAVIWASHADGGLWGIGGYGAEGATQRYDPETDSWSTHTPETVITPSIEYPMDGCYGLNAGGDEVVILFPDTIITGSLHIFNITLNGWYTETVPAFYPSEGRWGQDIVSLLNTPDVNQNVCYLSGGSPQEGGGRTRDLWVYHPDTNSGHYVGLFPADVWFNFHASWYVPRVGDQGSICVGGGIDHHNQINDSTQCYDLDTGTFNALNADLGSLPEPWWGMADGWQMDDGQYQVWIANGVAQDGTLLPASAYADAISGVFVSGPDLPVGLYRLEGDGFNGHFFTVQGAAGGFNYSSYNQLLIRCPTCDIDFVYLPLTMRE